MEVTGGVLGTAILLYAGYWAFEIRRALFVRSYRSQALWIGFFSLYFIFFVNRLDQYLMSTNSPIAYFVQELYYFFLAILLFRLIDVDVGLARRSDPLLREPLHWKQLRLVVWAIMAISISSLIFLSAYTIFAGFIASTTLVIGLQTSTYFSFLIPGIPAMFLGASRSRDEVFRRTLKWFGFFFLFLFVGFGAYFATASGLVNISNDVLGATQGYVLIPGAYCLYRSARSLAPLGRIPPSSEPEA